MEKIRYLNTKQYLTITNTKIKGNKNTNGQNQINSTEILELINKANKYNFKTIQIL